MKQRLLVADDDCALLTAFLEVGLSDLPDFAIDCAKTPAKCRELLNKSRYDVILLDIKFSQKHSDREGLKLIPEIREKSPESEIIVMSGLDDNATISKSLKLGAHSFTSKSCIAVETLAKKIRLALSRKKERDSFAAAGAVLADEAGGDFESEAMRDVFIEAAKARHNQSAMITGPTGSGKELIAKAIGRASAGAPFIAVNSASIPENLIESELFGHEKGAFTGAFTRKIGKFELASNGDLFLDELACLSLKAQASILRAIQSGEFSRLGGTTVQRAKVRVIAATNADLVQMVKDGTFREDLYERLARIKIQVPPLGNRIEDIRPIIQNILTKVGRADVVIAGDCMRFLERYSWPRNVRELENVVIAAARVTQKTEIAL